MWRSVCVFINCFREARDLHSHDADGAHLHGAEETLGPDSYIWKSLLFLTGGYIFFTFEVFMRAFGSQHSHSPDLVSVIHKRRL